MSIPSWPSSRFLRTDLARVVALLVLGCASARATPPPPDPDEVRDLRVTKGPGTMRLSWQPPDVPPDTYQVRRCFLSALPVPYYGNCVAQGLTTLTWEEPVPPGAVFYLVQGTKGGVEGSIGYSFDGRLWRPRLPQACSNPVLPGAMTVRVRLEDAVEFCGVSIVLSYPDGEVTFDTSSCSGLMTGALGASNDLGDRVVHQCAWGQLTGPTGPGTIADFTFQRGDCPLSTSAFRLLSCSTTNCTTLETVPATCTVR